ncbi:MAG: hypothetical protein HY900_18680 [Deltaproteobacteria bacterium]|nr:hypothetical protein [Deltaproteobacteria bacterium]
MGVLRDVGCFVVERKKFVLAPLLVILALMTLFVLLAEIPALTPFIYAIF